MTDTGESFQISGAYNVGIGLCDMEQKVYWVIQVMGGIGLIACVMASVFYFTHT